MPKASVATVLLTCALAVTAALKPSAAAAAAGAGGGAAAQSVGAAVPATIRVGVSRGSSYEVTTMPLETYIARVLAGEAASGSDPAALEALAITVRTFALANLGRHRADGFDLCDQTHCQVLRASTPATERAAQATAGEALMYRGALASVYYSASCGGHTARPSEVWPGAVDPPYLPSRTDDACEGEPAWIDDLSRADLTRALSAAGFQGILRDMRIASRDDSGRVARLVLDGMSPSDVSGQDLRTAVGRTLGAQHVKSAAFDLRRTGESFRFSGHGYGHGVGMCVIGSVKLAAAGESAEKILARYFPGATISSPPRTTRAPEPRPAAPLPPVAAAPRAAAPKAAAPSAALTVSLPAGDQGEEAAVLALVVKARNEMARSLAVAPSARVAVTFHATTADYERATGQPWFTSAVVVNQGIHLVPLASLRDRGVLERMIRREVVHLIVDGPLAQRPAWVREGAALYFADPGRNVAAPARAACPDDGELLSPTSAGALADAYARARACVARQLAAGRAWEDLR